MVQRILSRLRNGLQSPGRALGQVIGRIFPKAGFGPDWRRKGNRVEFREGGFVSGTEDRPGFSARNFYEICSLLEIISNLGITPHSSLEIGCGYGRISPWIARLSENHTGIDADSAAIERARELYPGISWNQCPIQEMAAGGEGYDLVVSWTVLQHIPPDQVDQSFRAIRGVVDRDGFLVMCEKTEGEASSHVWPRSVKEYGDLLPEFTLNEVQERVIEPGGRFGSGTIMVFQHTEDHNLDTG